jgi:hypothetical protein
MSNDEWRVMKEDRSMAKSKTVGRKSSRRSRARAFGWATSPGSCQDAKDYNPQPAYEPEADRHADQCDEKLALTPDVWERAQYLG